MSRTLEKVIRILIDFVTINGVSGSGFTGRIARNADPLKIYPDLYD